jgi:linoleoyl-CoA desaturase
VVHHTYPNLAGVDQDLEAGVFARFAPGIARHRFHRFQHIYVWMLYGLLTIKWMWVDDFVNVAIGRLGPHRLPRPRGWEWGVFFLGKALAIGWAVVVPVLVHGLWVGILFHVVGHVVAGVTLSVVFQLAHCVDEAEFPVVPTPAGGDVEWATHQLRTSVDFARGNPFLTFFLGGLNYQAIHHLFPHVSHVHYPAISPIVAAVCDRHGVRYRTFPSMFGAIRSHYRWLRRLGSAA